MIGGPPRSTLFPYPPLFRSLDVHPPAAPITVLPPFQIAVDRIAIEAHTGGHALHDDRELRAVGLAGGCESEARHKTLGRDDFSLSRGPHDPGDDQDDRDQLRDREGTEEAIVFRAHELDEETLDAEKDQECAPHAALRMRTAIERHQI